MDNHLGAAWCWAQCLGHDSRCDLVHIDRHFDALDSKLPANHSIVTDAISSANLDDYTSVLHPASLTSPLFKWDNYIWLFEHCYPECFVRRVFATHGQGAGPLVEHEACAPWELIQMLESMADARERPIVLNLDLDYFVCPGVHKTVELFGVEFRRELFRSIRKLSEEKLIAAMTVCLSPECAGGWPRAIALCDEFSACLGLYIDWPA